MLGNKDCDYSVNSIISDNFRRLVTRKGGCEAPARRLRVCFPLPYRKIPLHSFRRSCAKLARRFAEAGGLLHRGGSRETLKLFRSMKDMQKQKSHAARWGRLWGVR